MRTSAMTIAVFLLTAAASFAAAPQYTFSITVQIEDAPPVSLAASVPPGTNRTLHRHRAP